MVSLAPSQSSRLVSCFALTQSVSLDLVPSKLEQTFVVSAQVFKTTGTASFTGVSRKSCTRSTFHLLPYSEFALHMCFRSERPSVGCSGSELRSDKDQNSAIKNTSGHRSASSLSYKRGSVSLLGGCSTPNIPNIIAFSPPSCATVLHPENEVLLSFATHTLVYKLRPDVLRSSSASHPGSRVSPARLVVNGPNFNCLWAWPSTTKEGSGPLLSQSIPTAYHNESQLTTGLIILTSLKNSEGFLGIYIMPLLLYHSYRMNCSVDSLTLLPVVSSSSTRERILLPCLFSVKGDDSSGLIPRVCFNLLTGLPPCVAVCTGPEGAIETTSVSLVSGGWLSTSQRKVNRDPVSSEMLKMRQQLEYLQAELSLRNGGSSCAELQVLKERIASLETANEDLCRELHEYRSRCGGVEEPSEKDFKDIQADEIVGSGRPDGLKRSLHSIESSNYLMVEATTGDSREVDEEAKEWEHKLLQNSMDKELHELNRRLEEKESEMKLFDDPAALKQHFGKKIAEVEDEKKSVQEERNRLLAEIENLASSDGQAQKLEDVHAQNLKSLEAQIQDLKKKQESQVQLLKQKQKSDDAAKRLQDEIQSIKAQKVQLQHRMKQEAEQFRQWKASREKELLQLRKEGRKSEYERHKLQALNQRQKMVLQRKTEEAAMATKRLKELLEARKSSPREHSGGTNGFATNGQTNEKSLQRWLDHELEVMVNVHEVRHEYEKQSHVRAALAEELSVLRQVDEFAVKGLSPPRGKNGFARASSLSPNARTARISSLENMLGISSNSLVAMASQLSEAEERERAFTSRGRWNQLRSMGEAKNLLQYMFNSLAETRCQLWEKDVEIKEMKDQFKEIVGLLRQSELRRKEAEKEVKLREQAHATSLASSPLGTPPSSVKHLVEDMTTPSPMTVPAQKQLKFTPGIANGKVKDSAAFINTNKKMVPMGQVSMRKLSAIGQQSGKLWRWKRSHHQWIVQFKWKWQKPWRLSEWIRHSDETLLKAKTRHKALPKKIM